MINEAAAMRISFKEILLLKGIIDAKEQGHYTDSHGVTWVLASTALKNLPKQSANMTVDKAVGNGLVAIDDKRLAITKLGTKMLKAAEPSYATKLKEALDIPTASEIMKGETGQEILDAARADDLEAFYRALEGVVMSRDKLWETSKKVKDLMNIVRKGRKLYTVYIDYSQTAGGNEETHLRRNTLSQYEKQGYKFFSAVENMDGDELLYYK